MNTREEIEAAAERFEGSGGFACSFIEECEDVLFILAQAYITERDERPRRIEAATRQLSSEFGLCGSLSQITIEGIITRCLDGETT